MSKAIIVLQTDFTRKEGAVASMYGVIKSIDRSIEIIDASHEIPKFDIWSASYRLMQYVRFWPKGTIFVSVVDPGVGTSRKISVAQTIDGYYILSPDNGTFSHILESSGIDSIYEIDTDRHRLRGYDTETISVFHGRDICAYVAALLASGKLSIEDVGKEYSTKDIVMLPDLKPYTNEGIIHGYIEITDPNFGNIWTNIPTSMFSDANITYGTILNVVIKHNDKVVLSEKVPYEASFGVVEEGELVVYKNEMNKIAFAISSGNLQEQYMLGYGLDWKIEFSR